MLEGKTILITGSSRGIGAATARKIIEYGGRAILHGRTESDELKALADELHVPYVVADATDTAAVEAAVEHAVSFGSIEGLVTCAGIFDGDESVSATTDEQWQLLFETNVLGTIRFVRALVPHLKSIERAAIVLVSSRAGLTTDRSASIAYGATKAELFNVTASLARELAPSVRVNGIAPGVTDTEMTQGVTPDTYSGRWPLIGRMARADEIADVSCFLLSDRASFVTGQTIIVDGGSSIAGR